MVRALVVLSLLAALGSASADEASRLKTAEQFGRNVIGGNDADALALADEQLAAALGGDKLAQMRQMLVAQYGAVREVGAAFHEDQVQGYQRYRVPVTFEKQTVDLQVVVGATEKVAGLGIVEHTDRPAPVPQDATWRDEEVKIGPEGHELGGTLSLPLAAGKHPAVVLVHGSGPSDRDEAVGPNRTFRDLAMGLAARGIVVLRYDKRSFARRDEMLKIATSITVKEESIDDAVAAVALLRTRPEVDPQHVFVIGHSVGGTIAPRIAVAAKANGIVVLAGATRPLPETILEQARYIAAADGGVSPEEQKQLERLGDAIKALRSAMVSHDSEQKLFMGAAPPYYRDLEAHDPPREAAALGTPTLVLQGRRDYQVTMTDFAAWQAALNGKKGACLKSYEALDHLFRRGEGRSTPADYQFYKPVDPQVIGDIARFVLGGECN